MRKVVQRRYSSFVLVKMARGCKHEGGGPNARKEKISWLIHGCPVSGAKIDI
jgi:hypothetical protein